VTRVNYISTQLNSSLISSKIQVPYLLTVGNHGLVRVLEKKNRIWLLSIIIALRDGLGLGTVALALALGVWPWPWDCGLGLGTVALALALSVLALSTSLCHSSESVFTCDVGESVSSASSGGRTARC